MKKTLSLIFSTIMAVVLSTGIVSASNLSNQIEILPDGLSQGSIKYDITYENNITNITATLLVNDTNIADILSQTSGNPSPGGASELSVFYFGFDPKLTTGVKYKKQNLWIGEDLSVKTLDEGIKKLDELLDNDPVEEAKTYSSVWPYGVKVEYSTDNGETWNSSDTVGDGTKTIKQDLMDHIGITDENLLKYGKNFRFSMYDKYTALYGWEALDESDAPKADTPREYVSVNYVIEFPIQGRDENEQVYFITFEDAINSGSKEITVNENTVVNSNVVIPEGVEVTIASGKTLEIATGYTLENNGTIRGTVVEEGTPKTYYSVDVTTTGSGTASLNQNAYSGEVVTLTVSPSAGYTLKEIKGTPTLTKVSEGVYTFVMPSENVTASVVFEAITYSITPDKPTNGTLNVSKENAIVGDTITVDIIPNDGYGISYFEIYDVTNKQTISLVNGQFTMPAGNVEIYVSYYAIEYGIFIDKNENGKVFVDSTFANMNDVVELNVVPSKGYELKELKVINLYTGKEITVKDGKFTMPNGYVEISTKFSKVDYDVTVEPSKNGEVKTDKTTANIGDVVTIEINAEKGYVLEEITVYDLTNNKEITVKDGKFTMPAGDVEIKASFVDEKNPETLDLITTYFVINAICLISLLVIVKKKLFN